MQVQVQVQVQELGMRMLTGLPKTPPAARAVLAHNKAEERQ